MSASDPSDLREFWDEERAENEAAWRKDAIKSLTSSASATAKAQRELAAMRERAEKAERAAVTLGRVVDQQCIDAMNAAGMSHLIDESGDGDWALVWEELATLRPRAERAEAEVERLRTYAGTGPYEPQEPDGAKAPTWQELRTLADHNFGLYAKEADERRRLRATLAKVWELHPPVPIYVPCPDEGCERPDCVEVGLLTFVHTSEKVGTDCAECHDEDGGEVEWPCATLEAIDATLDADGGRDE